MAKVSHFMLVVIMALTSSTQALDLNEVKQ